MPENFIIPEIPEEFITRKYDHTKIKYIKRVTDINTSCAYLPPDSRVHYYKNIPIFCLQLDQNVESINKVDMEKGEIILIFQDLKDRNIKNKKLSLVKCFTHLVTPICEKAIEKPYGSAKDWPGRWVMAIAMTRETPSGSMPWDWKRIGWQDAKFKEGSAFQDLRQEGSQVFNFAEKLNETDLDTLQKNIWDRFQTPSYYKLNKQ